MNISQDLLGYRFNYSIRIKVSQLIFRIKACLKNNEAADAVIYSRCGHKREIGHCIAAVHNKFLDVAIVERADMW